MSKLAPTSIKYVIKAKIRAKGVIEKPDIIGAIFGQTEGLLGADLDLRELQRTGRIGRIEVKTKIEKGKTEGEIIIPSSLDSAETALIAATLETIERIGPCTAKIKLLSVEDTRSEKRKYVVDKAKEILQNMMDQGVPDSDEISEQIKEAVRTQELTTWQGLACGPNLMDAEDVIVVEGRADVINLLKYGIRNTIAVEGTSMPPAIARLSKEKTITLFVDGDRGGELIARELISRADVDYVAMAPQGKEVEELSKKEVYKALREKISAKQFLENIKKTKTANIHKKQSQKTHISHTRGTSGKGEKKSRQQPRTRKEQSRRTARLEEREKELFRKTLNELIGTRAACIFNDKKELLGKVPVTELENTLKSMESPYAVVFDGRVDSRINDLARRKGVKILIGMEKDKFYSSIKVLERKDLE